MHIRFVIVIAKKIFQTLNFTDLTPGTGVSEVQQVIVTHSCISSGNCETVGYRLIYGGVKTLFIRADVCFYLQKLLKTRNKKLHL